MDTERNGLKLVRTLGKAALLAGAFVGTLAVVAPPAEARDYHGSRDHHPQAQRYERNRGHRFGNIPRRVHSGYRSYYTGRSYYRPHRHDHVIYRYPVWIGGRTVYRPYSYCNDDLFVGARVRLPRIVIGFNSYGNDRGYDRYDRYPRYDRNGTCWDGRNDECEDD